MAFMRPEITEKQEWAAVETNNGTWWVPFDILSSREAESARRGDFEPLLQYTEGTRVYNDQSSIKKGYGVRLSAPGYMDASDWEVYGNLKEAQRRERELIKYEDAMAAYEKTVGEEDEGDHATKKKAPTHYATKKTKKTKTPHATRTKKSPAQLNREIAEVLAKPGARQRSSHAKAGRHGYENGQRVAVLDYLGREIGTGRARSGDNYPESNEYVTWVTMTRDGETVTEEHPTRRVVVTRR